MFTLLPKVDAGLEDPVDFIGTENMFVQPRNTQKRRHMWETLTNMREKWKISRIEPLIRVACLLTPTIPIVSVNSRQEVEVSTHLHK